MDLCLIVLDTYNRVILIFLHLLKCHIQSDSLCCGSYFKAKQAYVIQRHTVCDVTCRLTRVNELNATWKKHMAQWDDVISVTMTTTLPDSSRFTSDLIKCSLWEHSLFCLYETWTAQVSCRDLNCNKCWQIRSDSSRLYDSGVTQQLILPSATCSWVNIFVDPGTHCD